MTMYRSVDVSNAVGTTTDIQNAGAKRSAYFVLENKLKECTASRSDYKCINCVTFNAHNKDRKINENHSSLDQNCPSLQVMIVKYRQNTNY